MVGQQDVPALDPSHLPAPGSVFAGHLVEAMVGRGGMGVVFRARHRGLGRPVALKVIAPELLDDASIQRRFVDEAITAASIEHPNVVPVHDAGEADGVAYMVMRYVQGMDLSTMVRATGPMPPRRAAEIVGEVAAALDSMHRAGYVHRDVKPRNVLISGCGHVYLSDFGLAQQVSRSSGATSAGSWVGTVDYVAPEQICGASADARSDIYGLGGLLYFALTGREPYDRDTDEAKLWAHMYEPAPTPSHWQPGVGEAMDNVVARALAKDPAQRFASAGDLARAALAAAAAARPARAASPVRPAPSRDDACDPESATVSYGAASLRPARARVRVMALATYLLSAALAVGAALPI